MKNNKFIYIAIIAIFLLIIMQNIVLARYYAGYDAKVSSNIASPIIEISKENDEEKTKKITITDNTEFILNISNYNDNGVSQIGQTYYLKFYSEDVNISEFNIVAMKENKKVKIQNGLTEKFDFKANKKETHKYNVAISSNKINKTTQGTIKVKLISEQIKPS